jgi:beta-N-acetylglucosaminidase
MKNFKLKYMFFISTISILLNLNPIFAESNSKYPNNGSINTKSNMHLDVRSSPVWNSENLIGKFKNGDIVYYNSESSVNGYVRVKGTDIKTGAIVEGWTFSKYIETPPKTQSSSNNTISPTPTNTPTESATIPTPTATLSPTPIKTDNQPLNNNIPAIYSTLINNLLVTHPNWEFEFYDTKISLENAAESQYNMNNPVPKIDIEIYKETNSNIINNRILEIKNLYKLKLSNEKIKNRFLVDNNFFLATKEGTKYFMNPLNFIDEQNIYQFLELNFDSKIYSKNVMKNILSKTYFSKDLDNYTNWFYSAAEKYGLNPYFLISKAIVEGGASNINSTSILLTGFNNANKTYYNYFGINANDGSGYSNAKKYAIKNDWSTPEKAISGGAKFISKNYIEKGQDTFYTFRYNLTGEDGYIKTYTFSHQYASNIADSHTKSKIFHNKFNKYLADTKLKFKIPLYK